MVLRRSSLLTGAFLALLILFSLPVLDLPERERQSLSGFLDFLAQFFPFDWSVLPDVFASLLETIRISILATLSAVILSVPVSILVSARYSHPGLRKFFLFLSTLIRSIPSLVWALLAVSLLGPWPAAGVLALCFYSMGYLIKFFADALDNIEPSASQHLLLEGAHPIQAIQFGLWPQWRPALIKQSVWMLEYNIRSASIIGYVGAGGLGSLLHSYQEFYQWNRFSVVLLVILLTVLGLELVSRRLT
jgi:phosphonate transport system permease protein